MRDESLGVLRSEQMSEFRPGPIWLTEVGPGDGMEAGIPEPLERIHLGVGDGVALWSPVGLEYGSRRGPNRVRVYR